MVVKGLQGKPELNGCQGFVEPPGPLPNGRIPVKVAQRGEAGGELHTTISVKPANLIKLKLQPKETEQDWKYELKSPDVTFRVSKLPHSYFLVSLLLVI